MSSKSGVGKDPRHDIIVTLFQKIFLLGLGCWLKGSASRHGPKTIKNLLSDVPRDSGHPLEVVKPHQWGHGDENPSSKMFEDYMFIPIMKNA